MDVTNVSVIGSRNKAGKGFVVTVNKKQFNRFTSWEISHSIDIVPMSFSMTYALSDGEKNTDLTSLFSKAKGPAVDASGFLAVGAEVEISLDGYRIFTGYIDSTTNGLHHGQHLLQVSGRSKCQKITDGTTIQPNAGQTPGTLANIKQVADWLLTAQDGNKIIEVIDKTDGSTPQPLVNLTSINLTTRAYDFLANLAQYEGKLLYDDRFGRLVIDNPASGQTTLVGINDKLIKSFYRYRTNLGRFQSYTAIINPYDAIAGVSNQSVPHVMAKDQTPSEIPDGKILTFVSESSYPTSDATGWQRFQQNLVNVTAKRNWGRGDVINLSVVGTKNPTTNKPWEINSLLKINYGTASQPKISDAYVIADITMSMSRDEHETQLTLVRQESLGVIPVAITAPVAGVGSPSTQSGVVPNANQTKAGNLQVDDTPPPNAKPVNGGSK
ncbi:hypothetical protein HKD28_15295 [Gluconobacter sp. LMG 1744]|uniref:phage baseplate assembly protein n=1 Tax=Gluconobacter cadivus TaxID=2728101 RepID=UPI001885A400|nr:hypothetical protein [Gluconobacter cadivus]MBF0892756.1 hypothetical protein [Gluconobacter cadivus]